MDFLPQNLNSENLVMPLDSLSSICELNKTNETLNTLHIVPLSVDSSEVVKGSLDGSGIIYIGLNEEYEKTDPKNLPVWFPSDYLKKKKIFAIKEEQPYFLKIFTHIHEASNRVIRKKGGKKVMFMNEEVFGDTLSACGRCGYRSSEGSNVKRHLRLGVCLRDRGYSKGDLEGLSRIERRKFIRRIASAKFRAKHKKNDEAINPCITTNLNGCQDILNNSSDSSKPKPLKKKLLHKNKALLTLGPVIEKETIQKIPFDVFMVDANNIRVAWRPKSCPKAHTAEGSKCHIVFKGVRMKRRCLSLPLPLVLAYRKLDCKTHHSNFTLFHSCIRKAIAEDAKAQLSVNIKVYGETVMTTEFYHYFISLFTVLKVKCSQIARHLTGVWETLLSERLTTNTIPEEYKKLITLSKQTVKSIWTNIEEESATLSSAASRTSKKRKRTTLEISTPSSEAQPINPTSYSSQQQLPINNAHILTNSMPSIAPHAQHDTYLPQQILPQTISETRCHPIQHQELYHQPSSCVNKRFPTPFVNKAQCAVNSQSHVGAPAPSWLGGLPPHFGSNGNYSCHSGDYYSVEGSFISPFSASTSNGTSP